MARVLILWGMLFIFSSNVEAASVYAKNGDIFYISNEGTTKQLTSSGRDESPVLHPKCEWIYFIRSFEGKMVDEKYQPPSDKKIESGLLKEEMWRIKTDGTNETMLFQSNRAAIEGPDPDYAIATVQNIQFSPSGNKVYFETSEWVTSAGLHVMEADGSHEKLLGGGNDTKIILSATNTDKKHKNYQGYIVTNQHRYWWFGGAFDWYWLFTSDFKEVGPLGDDLAYFTETGGIKYTDQSEKENRVSKYVLPSR